MNKPYRLRAQHRAPEAAIQKRIVAMLDAYLPPAVWFSASLSGVKLSPAGAAAAKAAGNRKGAPDISFIWPDGTTTYIEVKAPSGTLTPEQAMLAERLGDRFAIARSWEDATPPLLRWMAPFGLRFLTDAESIRQGRAA